MTDQGHWFSFSYRTHHVTILATLNYFVVLDNITNLCLGHGFSRQALYRNISEKNVIMQCQRVWIQSRPTFETSRQRVNGIFLWMGNSALYPPSHALIQEILSVGVGSRPKWQKFFFFITHILYHFSPQLLILQRLTRKNYKFARFQGAGPTFSSWGVQLLTPIEFYITCDLLGWWMSGAHPHLDPRMLLYYFIFLHIP